MAEAGTMRKIVLTNIPDVPEESLPGEITCDVVIYVQGGALDIAKEYAIVALDINLDDLNTLLAGSNADLYAAAFP